MNLFFTFLDLQSLGVSPQNVFKSANLVSLTKSANENDQNLTKKLVAANFENDIGAVEVLGKKFRRTVVFLRRRSLTIRWRKSTSLRTL